MTYYVALHPNPNTELATIWSIDEKVATRIDATQVEKVTPGTFPSNIEVEHLPGFKFFQLKLAPGEFYPRMARPSSNFVKQSPGWNPEADRILVATGRGQLVALREQLERIFRTIHPTNENFEAYGHDIRNVLILAATEVEAHWKGILGANGIKGDSTKDYVKLLRAMKLDDYAILLPGYPWLDPVRPFAGWISSRPTQSLRWYDAYNAVKHDRETSFARATLLEALNSVCAVAVMLFAQFGKTAFHNGQEINSFFELIEAPQWDASDVYPVPLPGGSHTAKSFLFEGY
jgi:hypothetical protein